MLGGFRCSLHITNAETEAQKSGHLPKNASLAVQVEKINFQAPRSAGPSSVTVTLATLGGIYKVKHISVWAP